MQAVNASEPQLHVAPRDPSACSIDITRVYISNGPLVNQRVAQKRSWVDCVVVNVVVKVHYSTGVKDDPKSPKLTESLDTEHGNPIQQPQKVHFNIRNVAKGSSNGSNSRDP